MVFTRYWIGKKILKIGAFFIAFNEKAFRKEGFFYSKYLS